jgi:predicted enzyme related to lactoylglutathione lyase
MNANVNAINWFEISVTDMDRATKFYESIFEVKLEHIDMFGSLMGMFPFDAGNGKVSGALVKSPDHKPSMEGAVLYLNADPDLDNVLNRVVAAGGKLIMPKTSIGDSGFMAFFIDTEGNKMGLHSNG